MTKAWSWPLPLPTRLRRRWGLHPSNTLMLQLTGPRAATVPHQVRLMEGLNTRFHEILSIVSQNKHVIDRQTNWPLYDRLILMGKERTELQVQKTKWTSKLKSPLCVSRIVESSWQTGERSLVFYFKMLIWHSLASRREEKPVKVSGLSLTTPSSPCVIHNSTIS